MPLWTEEIVKGCLPNLKVRMPNNRNYPAKIVRIIGTHAIVRVDATIGSKDQYSWSLFQVSLQTVARCLNESRSVIY